MSREQFRICLAKYKVTIKLTRPTWDPSRALLTSQTGNPRTVAEDLAAAILLSATILSKVSFLLRSPGSIMKFRGLVGDVGLGHLVTRWWKRCSSYVRKIVWHKLNMLWLCWWLEGSRKHKASPATTTTTTTTMYSLLGSGNSDRDGTWIKAVGYWCKSGKENRADERHTERRAIIKEDVRHSRTSRASLASL